MPVSDIMTRLQNATGSLVQGENNDQPHHMNRYMGGHRRRNQPFVSGYWYLVMTPPERLFTDAGVKWAQQWFHTTAESFTPPTRTLTKLDIPGLGGTGSSFVGGQELSRTFTVAFREYQNWPIWNILETWTSIMDKHYGVTALNGNEFIPANYKGDCWAILTKPTIGKAGSKDSNSDKISNDDIEQVFYFEGVWPESNPTDSYSADIATNDTVQASVTFSFDGWPMTKEFKHIHEGAVKHITDSYSFNQYYKRHLTKDAENSHGTTLRDVGDTEVTSHSGAT